MFINHTNHPSQYWSDEQLTAAHQYGEVVDIPFPLIDPTLSSNEIGRFVCREDNCSQSTGCVVPRGVHILPCVSGAIISGRNYCISCD